MDSFKLLKCINSPNDIKSLTIDQLNILCEEIREFLVNHISITGGHLASNLGSVEITLAMHYIFNTPKDKIIFDVGHQCYTHKIITGRKDLFDSLRKEGGISGFTKPSESEHDAFIAGHSSTSISAGLGMSKGFSINCENNYTICLIGDGAFTAGMVYEALNNAGRDNSKLIIILNDNEMSISRNENNYTICLIGDGAFTAGMVYEALNNAGRDNSKLIIILNDNEMSISRNVGAFARYINNIRLKSSYSKFKKLLEKTLDRIPRIGKHVKDGIIYSKTILKDIIYHSNFFEDFGFHYIGPLDGHNLSDLISSINYAKSLNKPTFIHIKTIKGKGYGHAEKNPIDYHGVSKFNVETGNPDISSDDSFSIIAGKKIKSLADNDNRICAITAAMEYGTGLQYFHAAYPDRFFDVGIAEQHAVTFSVGLSCCGMVPIFAVYSTFLQRAYDQVIHDAAIQNQKIILCIDRAGVVGDDGETHQGIFDVAFLSCIPNISIISPSNYSELELALDYAVKEHNQGVIAIRYPRGKDNSRFLKENSNIDYDYIDNNSDILLITYGRIFQNILDASDELKNFNIDVSILKLITIKPIPKDIIDISKKYKFIYFFEEGIKNGGISQQLFYNLHENGFSGNYHITAIDDQFISQANVDSILKKLCLDKNSIVNTIMKKVK